ncbi:PAS domain-containing protein, partial [Treponema sp. R6D11]
TRNLAIILSALGAVFAVFLGGMLLRISGEKAASDERMQLMSESNPIAMSFMDKNFNVIDCNKTTLEMFGLSSKQEYFEKFYTLSPERQPDGALSIEKSHLVIEEALATGFCRFEWEHQKPDGEPIS